MTLQNQEEEKNSSEFFDFRLVYQNGGEDIIGNEY